MAVFLESTLGVLGGRLGLRGLGSSTPLDDAVKDRWFPATGAGSPLPVTHSHPTHPKTPRPRQRNASCFLRVFRILDEQDPGLQTFLGRETENSLLTGHTHSTHTETKGSPAGVSPLPPLCVLEIQLSVRLVSSSISIR